MKRIKDSHTLGIVSGFIGSFGMIAFDMLSVKMGYSKRSFSQAAVGMFVASKRQAKVKSGSVLGFGMALGLGSLGGLVMTSLLSNNGTDNLITKGIFYGAAYGGTTTALLSALPTNKIKPKDANSNLSYVLAHMIYGIITTQLISKLGDKRVLSKSSMNYINSKTQHDYISEQDEKSEFHYQH